MKAYTTLSCCLVLLSTLSQPLMAAQWHPLQDIRDTAIDFMNAWIRADQVEVSVKTLDSRLRMARCDQPLQGFKAPGTRRQGNTIVGVRCQGSRPWSLFVQVRVSRMVEVAVLKDTRPAGSRLKADDVLMVRHDAYSLKGGYFTDIQALEGQELRHNVVAGRVLNPRLVRSTHLVERGHLVTIVGVNQGIRVHMQGEALMDGARGERIRVRNLKSSRVIEAVVEDANTVVVKL